MDHALGKRFDWRPFRWPAVILFGLILPMVLYGLLPMYDIHLPGILTGTKWLTLMIGLPVLAVTGLLYFEVVNTQTPTFWLYYLVVFWSLVTFTNRWMIMSLGLDLHLRMFLIMALMVPLVLYLFRFYRDFWHRLPMTKYFLFFLSMVLFYYFFFNADVQDLSRYREGGWLEGNISIEKLFSFYFSLCGIVLAAVCFWKHSNPHALFDRLNIWLMGVTSVFSIVFLLGYPFHFFSVELDGFTRTEGLLGHPNLYAHQMGIFMVYFLGLFCYYQNENAYRMPRWFLTFSLSINLIGFLIGFSKTGFLALGLAALWVFATNLSIPAVRQAFMRTGIVMGVLVVIGLIAFQVVSGKSIFKIVMDRMNDQQSLNTRMGRWEMLMGFMDFHHFLTGHGHTAASGMIRMQQFNELGGKPVLQVHNGYLELMYDYGLLGYSLFLAVGSMVFSAAKRLRLPVFVARRPLLLTVIGLAIYYLVVMMFDEILYMSNASNLYWIFSVILLCLPTEPETNQTRSALPVEMSA